MIKCKNDKKNATIDNNDDEDGENEDNDDCS